MAIREVTGDTPVKNVYVVLKSTPPTLQSLAYVFGKPAGKPAASPAPAPFTIEGVYEDELDAARHAGSSKETWYTEQPLLPRTSR